MANRWGGMEREHLARLDGDSHRALVPSEGETLLACEYAKYKNRLFRIGDGKAIFAQGLD
jgi:hypothetical protein